MRARSSILPLAALASLVPALAFAQPSFPGFLQTHLSLSYTPDCLLCHTTPSGGIGTATTPFATSMKARGLSVSSTATDVNTALDALQAEGTDSDGDGVGDIAELQAHTDPNVPGAASLTPTYGCGGGDLVAPVRPAALPGIASLAGAIALAFALRRR